MPDTAIQMGELVAVEPPDPGMATHQVIELVSSNSEKPPVNISHPDFWIKKLTHLLRDYKDEIPDTMINSHSSDPLFKCRVGWFQSVLIILEMIAGREELFILQPILIRKIQLFIRQHSSTFSTFGTGDTTASDIAYANNILGETMQALRNSTRLMEMRRTFKEATLTVIK